MFLPAVFAHSDDFLKFPTWSAKIVFCPHAQGKFCLATRTSAPARPLHRLKQFVFVALRLHRVKKLDIVGQLEQTRAFRNDRSGTRRNPRF